jgi:hypothetical protein
MRKRSGPPGRTRVFGLVLILALTAAPAFADPVTVTGGISLNALEGPSFDLATASFRAQVLANPFNNGFDLVPDFFTWCGRGGSQCFPGDSVQMGGTTNGDAFIGNGSLTMNGTTTDDVDFFLDAAFVSPSVTVPGEQLLVQLPSPFDFAGTLRAISGGNEVLREALIGSGTATARLFLNAPGEGFFDENNAIVYQFESAQTPEPASLLLLGSGAAALAARRRQTLKA